jgi:hypothetical protein
MFNGAGVGLITAWYLIKQHQMHRIRTLSLSVDLVFGLWWRYWIVIIGCDQISRRLFVNYEKLREHKLAEYELKKIMVK